MDTTVTNNEVYALKVRIADSCKVYGGYQKSDYKDYYLKAVSDGEYPSGYMLHTVTNITNATLFQTESKAYEFINSMANANNTIHIAIPTEQGITYRVHDIKLQNCTIVQLNVNPFFDGHVVSTKPQNHSLLMARINFGIENGRACTLGIDVNYGETSPYMPSITITLKVCDIQNTSIVYDLYGHIIKVNNPDYFLDFPDCALMGVNCTSVIHHTPFTDEANRQFRTYWDYILYLSKLENKLEYIIFDTTATAVKNFINNNNETVRTT